MRAVLVEEFGAAPRLADVADPAPAPHGVVVAVQATGVCRSDWHAWQGHDDDVTLPHVPGHELAGTVVAVGADVRGRRVGDRVTTPFVTACGTCPECAAGQQQVCRRQTQPGFTGWGSFAELVALDHADVNLVALPEGFPSAAAAALGCRVATAFRAVTDVARVRAGESVAVHGAGGVGLSAIAIAAAAGARVVAVDPSPGARDLALAFGAEHAVAADGAVDAVRELTGGGAHVSIDAVGLPATCEASVRSLRRRGRHVQIGLLPAATGAPLVPMDLVIAGELQVLGSHGMAAHDYPRLLALVGSGRFPLAGLVTRELPLEAGPRALAEVGAATTAGITVLRP
ncbi:zinc-binding dehydrogenase [Kineococcus radiotolerans]|uniref:Alcohol dehydrogenase zinc-binding domain protein n=1 Tax=Kineococcus radiotolerans (strain ATCC BAA-149 / DSM 14245 / SRS30216) TaxID=266940 RepID=A6WG21_KINRD|nr:zinc-binding dehydrogenase [Kineococcus radiotolerans]ABS05760.1 Alcohol dehydrogenase zinc-binding domain protein [Kineococcus radiotolerans SRS30216 = ATCC BAA-149]